jgi:hypothetical protein
MNHPKMYQVLFGYYPHLLIIVPIWDYCKKG